MTCDSNVFSSPLYPVEVVELPDPDDDDPTTGDGELTILNEDIWLGWIKLGEYIEVRVRLKNTGDGPLSGVAEIDSGPLVFHFPAEKAYTIPPGGTEEVIVHCLPISPGGFVGTVNFTDGTTNIICTITGNSIRNGVEIPEAVPTVIVTEIQTVNPFGPPVDEDDNPQPWVELHNYGNEAVDISGWALSDDPRYPEKWTFPESVVIAAGEYLLINASDLDRRPLNGDPALHTNFSFSGDPGVIMLSGFYHSDVSGTKEFSTEFGGGSTIFVQSFVRYPAMLQGTSFSFFGTPDVSDSNPTFIVSATGQASPGTATPFEATNQEPKTWTLVPFRLVDLRTIDSEQVISPPAPSAEDQLFTGEIVAQWCAEATTNIINDEDSETERYFLPHFSPFAKTQYVEKGNNDCACTGVEVNIAHPDVNLNPVEVMLPTVGDRNSDLTDRQVVFATAIDEPTIKRIEEDLWKKKFSTRFSGDTEKVFALFIGAKIKNSGEVDEGLRGYLVGDTPRLWPLVFMVNTPHWDWTTVTHELGHYVGIDGHWNGNEHPSRITASEPHNPRDYPKWKSTWMQPAVTMTQEECAYWRGAWDRLTYDSRFYPEGKHDPNFSYYSESHKKYWDEWINKEDYLYLERPDSANSP